MGGEEEKSKDVAAAAAAVKRIVKQLNFGGSEEERAAAASEVGRLARADGRMKRFLAELGVVSTLVCMMFDSRDLRSRISAVEALIELGRGTFKNKVLMVEAGLLTKLPQLMPNKNFSRSQELFLLLSSVSSLVKTDFALDASCILPLVFETLNAKDATENAKSACLTTLYNLSTKLDNLKNIVSDDTIIHALVTLSLSKGTSEGALSTLSNLVVSPAARRRIEGHPAVPKAFVEIMSWDDRPKCRELAVYLTMVVARNGCRMYREKLVGHGAVGALLETALLGSDVARRRAMKVLQWIRDEGEVRMRVHSGPRVERVSLLDGCGGGEEMQCRRAIGEMVKESLKRNMTSILRKATATEDFSGVKGLCTSSSSKSLPY